jgi:hypothetical protein
LVDLSPALLGLGEPRKGVNKKMKAKNEIVKVETKKSSWSDAGILMKKAATPAEAKNQQMIIALSIAFNIPPQGITILSDNPYINKSGLEYMFNEYKEKNGWAFFLSTPIETAKQAGDTAFFRTEVFDTNGRVVANGFGTANAGNIRMGTIKVFLNEMAETRSQNRCLRKILSPILYKNFIDSIRTLKETDRELIAEAATNFGSVTAEEIAATSEEEVKAERLLTEEEMKGITIYLGEINSAKTQEALETIRAKVTQDKDNKLLNPNQLKVLAEAWSGRSKSLAFNKE